MNECLELFAMHCAVYSIMAHLDLHTKKLFCQGDIIEIEAFSAKHLATSERNTQQQQYPVTALCWNRSLLIDASTCADRVTASVPLCIPHILSDFLFYNVECVAEYEGSIV